MKITAFDPANDAVAAAAPGGCCDSTARLHAHLENILVPLDFSKESLNALRHAVPLARKFGAKLTLLHVLRPPICVSDYPYPGPGGSDCFEGVEKELDEIRTAKIPPGMRVETVVRQSFAVDGILDVAREIHADLIITTARARTRLGRLFSRSISGRLARRAPCPVLVARDAGG